MNESAFPRYREFDPAVPVWCLTPVMNGCIHRFFDTSPVSPSGRYIAVFQLPFVNRMPAPGEIGRVRVIDLETGKTKFLAGTSGWETQTGANINWGGSDRELYFNDVDRSSWKVFSWKVDFMEDSRIRMEGPVYHASPDGRLLVSANPAAMRRTQPGYGAVVPEDFIPFNRGPVDDDGFYVTDTLTGKTRLFLSIKDLVKKAAPPASIEKPDENEFYCCHSKFNSRGNMVMLCLRWFPAGSSPRLNIFKIDQGSVKYAWFTASLDDKSASCAVGPEQWEKGGHHATWFPEVDKISMNLRIDRGEMRFVEAAADGSTLSKMHPGLIGSGHPTVCPGGAHIVTDAYLFEKPAFGDGTVPIRLLDLRNGTERTLARINVRQPVNDGALRVDPHPAWDRSRRYLIFNGFTEGARRVFMADMAGVLE